jgi:hypothetical protein
VTGAGGGAAGAGTLTGVWPGALINLLPSLLVVTFVPLRYLISYTRVSFGLLKVTVSVVS